MAFPDDIVSGGNLIVDELISGLGYDWTDWSGTVAYDCSGSMTYTSVSTTFYDYRYIGDDCMQFRVYASGTTGGTASTDIRFTLPVTPANNYENIYAHVADSGRKAGIAYIESSKVIVRKYDSSNWALGSSKQIYVCGFVRFS